MRARACGSLFQFYLFSTVLCFFFQGRDLLQIWIMNSMAHTHNYQVLRQFWESTFVICCLPTRDVEAVDSHAASTASITITVQILVAIPSSKLEAVNRFHISTPYCWLLAVASFFKNARFTKMLDLFPRRFLVSITAQLVGFWWAKGKLRATKQDHPLLSRLQDIHNYLIR